MPFLEKFGWNSFFENQLRNCDKQLTIGRVCSQHRTGYIVLTQFGEIQAELCGRLSHHGTKIDFPTVGDWVGLEEVHSDGVSLIDFVFQRKTQLVRKQAGKQNAPQLIAANVDTVFLLSSFNEEFNIRRLERYLSVVYESGAKPVIVLTKADVCQDTSAIMESATTALPFVEIIPISSVKRENLDALTAHLTSGNTVACVGSSGVGKSTLLNTLMQDDLQATLPIRDTDAKGRHTTTHRELFQLPSGALFIDTPGMRELQIWEAQSGIEVAFEDVVLLSNGCKFRDCAHANEPGCAILSALESGELDAKRYKSFLKLKREDEFMERKNNKTQQIEEKEKWKKLSKMQRQTRKSVF